MAQDSQPPSTDMANDPPPSYVEAVEGVKLSPRQEMIQLDETDESIPAADVIEIEVKESSVSDARGKWRNELDVLFACISATLGIGNVWRFPYLCFKNGGGAFLIVYFIAMIIFGIPMCLQELAIGQYLGSGGMTLTSELCPLLKGVGISSMALVFFLNIYYCIIIAWTFYYLIATFTALPGLPWDTCDKWWNTDACYISRDNLTPSLYRMNTSAAEQYWEHRVLQQNEGLVYGLGGFQFELFGCLLLSWVVVYGIIYKGLYSSGKIIWFTALFPIAVMAVLLVRAVTLEGAYSGLAYYVHFDWSKMLKANTWIDAATQILFTFKIGLGSLPALGSYNKFNHNCVKDTLITCVVNTLTCLVAGVLVFALLGYMAHLQDLSVADMAWHDMAHGTSLAYITFPDLVVSIPGSPLWAFLFFMMILIFGVRSQFCAVEGLVTGIVDNWPGQLLTNRKKFTVGLCVLLFSLGVPLCTHGGMHLFQLMDGYSGLGLYWICLFQTVVIGWGFGADKYRSFRSLMLGSKLSDCVAHMTGGRPNMFWIICWKFLAPVIILFLFIYNVAAYEPLHHYYTYPLWAEVLGLFISYFSVALVPAYAIYYLIRQPGTLLQKLRNGLTPTTRINLDPREAQELQEMQR